MNDTNCAISRSREWRSFANAGNATSTTTYAITRTGSSTISYAMR